MVLGTRGGRWQESKYLSMLWEMLGAPFSFPVSHGVNPFDCTKCQNQDVRPTHLPKRGDRRQTIGLFRGILRGKGSMKYGQASKIMFELGVKSLILTNGVVSP
jgi:hypothetical protein